ncbi:Glucan endo-1,3-beta-glucosidase 1 [Spatholobus suberectus]|nr:Glucan endo-1,3-beta-glucosidase 1 [Spatholobus suberectus]
MVYRFIPSKDPANATPSAWKLQRCRRMPPPHPHPRHPVPPRNLDNNVVVSTPHSVSVILDPFPPSPAFRKTSILPLLHFLSQTNSCLMLNLYPYYNLNITDVVVLVTKTGWPSVGDSKEPYATTSNSTLSPPQQQSVVTRAKKPILIQIYNFRSLCLRRKCRQEDICGGRSNMREHQTEHKHATNASVAVGGDGIELEELRRGGSAVLAVADAMEPANEGDVGGAIGYLGLIVGKLLGSPGPPWFLLICI